MKAAVKPVVFVLSLLPALYLFYAVYQSLMGSSDILGPDPAQELALRTGHWTIRFLILTLALTPIRFLFIQPMALRLRRMIGLYTFFYGTLHFLVFLVFLLQLQWGDLGTEITERPYITVGFSAFILMLPLALTSFNAAQRRLGRNWKRLHRLVYVTAILAVIHVIWIVRSSWGDAMLYGSLVVLLLGYRLLRRYVPAVRKFRFVS